MKHSRIWLFLIAVVLVTPTAWADGLIVVHHPTVVPPGHYPFAPLEVKYHHVDVKIKDQIAVTSVDQVFYNPNDQRLEGTYLFPIPAGAQIDTFTMFINGTQVEAELLSAEKARKIYEDIVRSMRDPALLEYAGRGLFKVRIFPIEPRSEKRVSLRYTEILHDDGGLIGYLYPLNTEKFSAQPIKTVSIKVEIEASGTLKSIYSPSHAVEVKRHGPHRAVAGFETNDARPDTDFKLFYSTDGGDGSDIRINLLSFHDGEGGYFLLLASPGEHLNNEQIVRKDVVFVLDTSGSMAGKKLAQAKRALRFCLANLNAGDRFEIVRFSTEAEALFEGLVEASEANVARADAFVEALKPIGGTAIEEALLRAVKSVAGRSEPDRPSVVIFLTDGRPTVGTLDTDQILARVSGKLGEMPVRIFCFGIGTDINTHLLDKITERTKAVSQYVLPAEDIEVKVSSFYTKINYPVLADVQAMFDGPVRVSKMYPSSVPGLFKGDQLVVLGRYTGSGEATVSLEGTVNGRKRVIGCEALFASKATENEFIPRLWATRRIGFLLDQIRLHGENAELRDEVAQLARQYGIVTPYTAYLILEDEEHRGIPGVARTLRKMELDAPARRAAGESYRRMRDDLTGYLAVAAAQSAALMKSARSDEDFKQARKHAERGTGGRLHQPVRYIGGRAFYRNGDRWIDGKVQSRPAARRQVVELGSDAYFDLLRRHPEAVAWLSVGPNVELLLGDTVYEISH